MVNHARLSRIEWYDRLLRSITALDWVVSGTWTSYVLPMSNNIHQQVLGGGGVQLPSLVQLFATLLAAAHQASLSFAIYQSFLKYISIESVMLSNHLIVCHPLLLLPSVFPSINVFSSESALCIRWQAYWSFSISPENIQGWFPLGLTGLISLWFKGFFSTTI